MIYELNKDRFARVFPIIHNGWPMLDIKSVLAGNSPGWVFADSMDDPKTAMIWTKGEAGFYFVGDAENAGFLAHVRKYIHEVLKDRMTAGGLDEFEFSADREEWNGVFEEIFAAEDLKKSEQRVNILNKDKWERHEKSDPEKRFTLRNIDRELFSDASITNPDFLASVIKHWWFSLEEYFDKAIGYCFTCDNKIVCYCYNGYFYENNRTIGIKTLAEYRRMGLAQAAAEAFISESLSRGEIPYWECDGTNAASRALAEKLGFDLAHVYPIYWFSL